MTTALTYLDDPFGCTKEQLYRQGKILCNTFWMKNNVRRTEMKLADLPTFTSGCCDKDECSIDLAKCTPTMASSFPGAPFDHTPIGVCAHEAGHWTHLMRNLIHRSMMWINITKEEAPVSDYRPNHSEEFAEALRLFIVNPHLLADGRPRRFDYIRYVFRVEPIFRGTWQSVLKHAPPQTIREVERWIAQAR